MNTPPSNIALYEISSSGSYAGRGWSYSVTSPQPFVDTYGYPDVSASVPVVVTLKTFDALGNQLSVETQTLIAPYDHTYKTLTQIGDFAVWASASPDVPYWFEGYLRDLGGNPLAGLTVSIYYGPTPTTLNSKVDVTTTDSTLSNFVEMVPAGNFYQARFAGDSTYAASESDITAPIPP